MKKIVIILISLIVLGGISTGTYFIFRHNHNFVCYVVEPTFESDGYYQYTCDCGNSYTEFYEQKLQHTYDQNYSYDNTNHWFSCLDEGYEDLYIDLSSHEFNSRVVNPTGQTQGYTLYECQVCDYSYKDNYVQARKYTVQWVNHDNTVLEVDNNMSYGSMPSYDSSIPTRPSNSQFTYVFAGWDKEIDIVTKDITYIAVYSEVENKYKVVWQNWDGANLEIDEEVEYGTMPSYDANKPTKPSTSQYYYTFSGWSPVVSIVTGDVVYTAQYTENKMLYEVIWKNSDGTILEIDNVLYGDMPNYNGNTPTIASSDLNDYTFSGWSPVVSSVTGDVVYTAQYTKTIRTYKVIWKNYDGTILETDDSVLYGVIPTYNGNKPTKDSNSQYTYTFSGWSPNVNYVRSDVVYVAQYTYTINKYTITWKNWDGTVLEIDENIEYGTMPSYDGETPTKEKNNKYRFEFIEWTPEVKLIEGNVTYIACFEEILRTEFYITYNLNGGTGSFEVQSKNIGEAVALSLSIPTLSNHRFIGWNNIYEDTIYQAGDYLSLDVDVELWAMWEELCTTCDGDGKIENVTDCSNCVGGYKQTYYYYCYNDGTLDYDEALRYCKICEKKVDSYFMGKLYCDYCRDNTSTKSVCRYCLETAYLRSNSTYCTSCSGTGNITTFSSCTNCVEGVIAEPAPTLINIEYNSIELRELDGYEYSIDRTNWQTSALFEGLHSATQYTLYQRVATSGNVPFGITSQPLVVTTPDATKYIITYELSGGSTTNPTEYTIESEDIVLLAPVKLGYTFIGWIYEGQEEPIKEVVLVSGSIGDRIYTAVWSINTYTITYDLGGGTIETPNIESYTVLNDDIVLLNPTREHYDFLGWEYDGVIYSVIETSSVRDYEMTANWEPREYTITYNLDGGVATNPTTHNVESPEIILSVPIKNGYTFSGWTGSNGEVADHLVKIEKGNTENLTFTANWVINYYNITYELNGGKNALKNPITYTIIDTISLMDASKEGYTFEGWFTEAQFTNEITSLNGNYSDLILYAKFNPITYETTFDINEGFYTYKLTLVGGKGPYDTSSVTYEVKSGENLNSYLLTTSSYGFLGWYYENGTKMSNNDIISRDTTLTAKWSTKYAAFTETLSYSADAWEYNYYFSLPANYDGNISYVATIRQDVSHNSKYASSYAYIIITDLTTNTEVIRLDGDEYSNIVVKRGNLLLTPGHEYKVFLFAMEETVWVPYPDLYYDTATSSCLIELDAPTKIKYNVSVISESPIISQTYDAIIQTPTNIFRPGYNFVGWFTEDGESIDETYIYASNQTFYAKWEVQNFSINYNLNGGENNDNNPFSYIIEDNIVLEEPTKEGYEFLGWYTESSFINKINVIKGTDCKDYDLHACWRANSYTVTLDYNGGQNCPVIDFYSEGEIYKTVILYKDLTLDYFTPTSSDPSYVFAGWYLDEKCTIEFSFDGIVNKDLKVYAKWLLISEKYSPLGSDVQVNINGTARQYIEIISLVNQEITIKSVSEFDLYGEIYDENMNLLLSSDDISNDELDFCFTVSLIAGIKYYIAYKANQNSIVGNSIISIGGTSDKITHITGDITQKIDSINVYFDDAYFLPKPYREGYEFIGWVDENGIAVDLTCWKYASDSTIYAKWALIE